MELWKANDDIYDKMTTLIGMYHPDLALISEEIAIVFRTKAGKSGGQVILGASKKVTPLANVLSGEDFKFVLEIGADVWENDLTERQREALLDHLLTSCRCEEDPKSGEFKCTVARPDISAFRENVDRYGMWFPKEPDDEDKGPSPVEDMFGKAAEAAVDPT